MEVEIAAGSAPLSPPYRWTSSGQEVFGRLLISLRLLAASDVTNLTVKRPLVATEGKVPDFYFGGQIKPTLV